MIGARRRARGWRVAGALRVLAIVAYALLGLRGWQLVGVEVVEHAGAPHEEAPCPDDDGPCDCGDNCHCCVACAHQTTPAIPGGALALPVAMVGLVELPAWADADEPPSNDRGPPQKVPKHLG